MGKVFFTSDLHIGHENVMKFDKRPWNTVQEMNEGLIQRWNRKVEKGDLVYVLGDMFWKGEPEYIQSVLRELNGEIILVKGNHDKWLNNPQNVKLLAGVKDYDDVKVTLDSGEIKRCILSHYFIPMYNGHYHGTIMLHGHSHSTKESEIEEKYKEWLNANSCPCHAYNVGCMYWNYEPVTLDEILGKKNGGK